MNSSAMSMAGSEGSYSSEDACFAPADVDGMLQALEAVLQRPDTKSAGAAPHPKISRDLMRPNISTLWPPLVSCTRTYRR